MPPSPPPENQVPLVVDLDGTLIKTDLLWESHRAAAAAESVLRCFAGIYFWWTRGRALLEAKTGGARPRLIPPPCPTTNRS
jgi:hypothetical protein